jgi:hypothetical protein
VAFPCHRDRRYRRQMSLAGKEIGRPTGRRWKPIAPREIALDETERFAQRRG